MIGHLRVKSPWSQLGIFLGLFGGAFLVTSILMAVVVLATGVPTGELNWTDPQILPLMKLMQAVSSILIFLLPAVLYAVICFRGKPFYFLGLRSTSNVFYLLAIAGVLLAFPFVMWLGELNHNIPLPKWMIDMEKDSMKQMQAFLKAENAGDVILNVIIIALLPAICEEVCFRGALQRIVIEISRNAWLGIILTSLFFSAMHLQFQGFFPRLFLGVVLGAMYWYSNSLWPSIVAHFVHNAVQVVAVSYAPEFIDKNPSMPIALALGSGLVSIWILWQFREKSTVTFEKVYDPEGLNRNNQFLA